MGQITIFGQADERTQAQMHAMVDAGDPATTRGVLCADNHLGYGMPIGGVVAYRDQIAPAGVGFDIACGNLAVGTTVKASDVDVARVMDEIAKVISFGVGRKNTEHVDQSVLDEVWAFADEFQMSLYRLAADQLGTVGSGNHYVDLFENRADGMLWVGVHFGSRGFGHKTAMHFLQIAAEAHGTTYRDDMDAVPHLLRTDMPSGQDYLHAMDLAGRYAYAGREWVVNRVLQILGAQAVETVHNHHNFAWREQHFGETYWVIRKGATPAFPGQRGFVGGSMGEDAVILEGVQSELSAASLYSTVHGAGRVLSRKKAKGKTKTIGKWRCLDYRTCSFAGAKGGFRKGPNGETPRCPECGHKLRLEWMEEQLEPGLIDWPQAQSDVKALGIELRGAGADEAPACYKRLPDVLAAHRHTIRIVHRLRVIGVAMAGHDVHDPYKD